MAVGDTSGTVTIWERGRRGFYADEHGVTVANSARRVRRLAWAEISRFQEGGGYDPESGGYIWAVVIVLHTGEKVSAVNGWYGSDAADIATAVTQVAERHGIPADVAGVPMKDGRPVRRGLYHDPGGQAGLRFWDDSQWSPLLPPDIAKPGSVLLPESPVFWSKLPTADGHWTYPKLRARRLMVWSAVFGTVSAALMVAALLLHRRLHGNTAFVWMVAVVPGVWAVRALNARRFLLKLDRAARQAAP
jgi:hypothetical protein